MPLLLMLVCASLLLSNSLLPAADNLAERVRNGALDPSASKVTGTNPRETAVTVSHFSIAVIW